MTQTVTQALSKLTSLDWFVVFAGLGFVAALEVSKIAPEPSLSRADQAFIDWGSDESGFGAFARGPDGKFGWVTGRGSAEVAHEDALAYCQASGGSCRVIAYHDGTVYNAVLDRQITPSMEKHFGIYLSKPTPRAVAISEDGSIGYSTRAASVQSAVETALKTCAQYQTQKSRPAFLPDRPCFVVHQTQ